MAKVSDLIQQVSDSADQATTRVTTDVAALNAQIATLQQEINDGDASDADVAAFAALKAKVDAIDPTNPATITPAAPAAPTS